MFLYVFWLLRGQDLVWERYWIGNLTIVFSSGLAAYLAWTGYQKSALSSDRKAWLWITCGLTLWLLLDVINLLLFINKQPDIISVITHFSHLAGGMLVWVGLIIFPRNQRVVLSKAGFFLDIGLTFCAFSLLLWDAWVQPVFNTLVAIKPTALVFILVDIVSFVLILLLFLATKTEEIRSVFAWIILAVLSYSVSDMNYLISNSNERQYSPGTVLDLGWVIGNMFIVIAIITQTDQSRKNNPKFISRIIARSQYLLPILSILLLGWYAILNWQLNGVFDTFSLWGTLILSLGLLVRQGIQTGENAMEQYARLVNSIAEPAFVCDEHGKLQLVNHAFLDICQFPRSRLLGSQLNQFFVLKSEDQTWLENLFKNPRKGEEVDTSREVELKTNNDVLIPVILTFRSIETSNQKHLTYAVTTHDLRLQKQQQGELLQAYEQVARARTELELMNVGLEKMVNEKTSDLKQAYQTLEEQNKALQQLDQIKSDFVSLVSHELRAPLTNIRGGIELLMVSPNSEQEKTYHILNLVQSEMMRLSTFTETILDLSAMDANRLPLYPEPLDLSTITSQLQQFFSQTPGSERISWNINQSTPIVLADKKALHSVLFHLVDNALKYAPTGEIQINAFEKNDSVCIQVRDFGPGISPSVIPHIFDRFYRGNMTDSQTVYGHGLGLYMVKRFVDAMNGEVVVENKPPKGVSFSIFLPQID